MEFSLFSSLAILFLEPYTSSHSFWNTISYFWLGYFWRYIYLLAFVRSSKWRTLCRSPCWFNCYCYWTQSRSLVSGFLFYFDQFASITFLLLKFWGLPWFTPYSFPVRRWNEEITSTTSSISPGNQLVFSR